MFISSRTPVQSASNFSDLHFRKLWALFFSFSICPLFFGPLSGHRDFSQGGRGGGGRTRVSLRNTSRILFHQVETSLPLTARKVPGTIRRLKNSKVFPKTVVLPPPPFIPFRANRVQWNRAVCVWRNVFFSSFGAVHFNVSLSLTVENIFVSYGGSDHCGPLDDLFSRFGGGKNCRWCTTRAIVCRCTRANFRGAGPKPRGGQDGRCATAMGKEKHESYKVFLGFFEGMMEWRSFTPVMSYKVNNEFFTPGALLAL